MTKIQLRIRHRTLKQALSRTAMLFMLVSIVAIAFVAYQAAEIFSLYNQHRVITKLTIDLSSSAVHGNQLLTAFKELENPTYSKTASAILVPLTALQGDRQALTQDLKELDDSEPILAAKAKQALHIVDAFIAISRDILKISRDPTASKASLKTRYDLLTKRQNLLETNLKIAISHSSRVQVSIQRKMDKSLNRLLHFLIVIMAIWLLLGWGSFYNINKQIIVPITDFTKTIKIVATGKTDVSLPLEREDEIGELARAFQQLLTRVQEARARLNAQVEERTRALQRRTAQLQTATEVSRAVATERNINRLLPTAARLISQRYGYYHVGIFLTSPDKEYAELKAVYNQDPDLANELQHKNIRVAVGLEGLVGRTIGSGRPQIAESIPAAVRSSYKHLLPESGSAIALPIKAGSEILGAIDIQCRRESAFPPEDVTALQTVADQLAVALQNLRLLQETQEALETSRRAYAQLSEQGWQTYLSRRRVVGYRLLENGEMLPTTTVEKSTTPKDSKPQPQQTDERTLHMPIKVRGITIAKARLTKTTPWNANEKRLLQRLTERVGLALEGARLYAEAQHRAAQLQIAAEIAREANSTLALEDLLEQAVNLVRERFQFYHASIFLLDDTGHYMVVRASTGEAGKQMLARGHKLAIGSASIVGQTAARGEPVVVNDVSKSEIHHFNPLLPNTRSEMGVPLKAGDEVIGVLDIQSEITNAFTEDDVRILQIMTDQLAVAVINAQLFAETQRHIEHHRALHQITTAAASAISIEDAIRHTTEMLANSMPNSIVAFLKPEQGGEVLQVAALAGNEVSIPPEAQNAQIHLGEEAVGKAAATGEPITMSAPDATLEGTLSANARAQIAVPLIYRGRLLGVLDVENPSPNAYGEAEREMLVTLANSLAAILANIGLLEQVRQRSEELETLYEITSAAASEVDLDALLQLLTSKMQEKLDLLHCGVILFDEDGKFGTITASTTAPDAPKIDVIGTKIPIDMPLIQELLHTKKPVVSRDTLHDARLEAMLPLIKQRGASQVIMVPLLAREEIIGVLGLDIEDPEREITENDLRLLEQIAHQIATSIEVARLFKQAVRTAEREHLLAEITAKLRATNDPMVIIQTAVEEMRRALNAQTTQILLETDNAQNE